MQENYKIKLSTPMGVEEGVLSLVIEGNKVSGNIKAKNTNNYFRDGIYENGRVVFKGKVKMALFSVDYEANCNLQGNILRGSVKTKYGILNVEGSKI